MKKILLFLAVFMLGINLSAQTSLTQAVDFTATDCHGTEVHLFDILDQGQYVLIDFFYTTCGPCNAACPFLVQSYQAFGCNDHDVYFMEISNSDGDAACQAWCNTYGVEYPTIGTSGNGGAICNSYGIHLYPTVILIAPDRQIVIQDLYPIPSAQTVINQLMSHGIEQNECGGAVVDPSIDIAIGEVTSTTVEATFTPNEACASYYILIGIEAEMQSWVGMMGQTIEQLVQAWGIEYTEAETYTWTEQLPNTEYTVYALPLDGDGTFFEMQTQKVTTEQAGGTGVSVIDITVEVVSETSVKTIATPNGETAEYHYGLITKELYDEIGADSAVQIFRNDNYPLHEIDEWTWNELQPNTYYYALSTGINANNEWGETTMVEFFTSITAVADNQEKNISIYPIPAHDFLKISGCELQNISIYNALGQKVADFEVNASEIEIPTASYKEGVYFIKTNDGQAKRFIVSH